MPTSPELIRITDESTRAEIAEALGNYNQRAKREWPVVGTIAKPSPWDIRHDALNAMLTDWQAAPTDLARG